MGLWELEQGRKVSRVRSKIVVIHTKAQETQEQSPVMLGEVI